MAQSNGQLLTGNSVCTLRYPSGAPETSPHRGEMREDVHCMGSHWNFRFRDKRKHTFGAEIGSSVRPKSAYPDLSPNKAASQDTAKTLVTSRSEKEGERPTTGRVGAAEADTAGRGVQEGGRGTSGLKSLALARGPKDAHGHAESESVPQDANALSISVGRDGAALGTRADGPYKGSTDHTGKMLWGGLDGEQISPRHFHRKRTDLTSRGQARMGYGMKPSEVDYTVKVQERPVLGQKRVKTKRLKQKQFAESIASATELHRPKSGGLGLGMPNHSALPLNRPSEANWAYQTLYMPKTVVHWNPGNVSKIVRNINYEQERPTFGPHFSSN